MAANMKGGGGRRGNRLRVAAWSGAALFLLLPLVAMQFTDEVNWRVEDFVVVGTLVLGTGLLFEIAVRRTSNGAYRAAVGIALAAAFLLVWLSLGVGIIGRDGDPANLMYFGVLAVGAVGAVVGRFEARGMAGALIATAIAQTLVAAIAVIGGLGRPWSGPVELVLLNGFFVALFVGSALLFRNAARGRPERA